MATRLKTVHYAFTTLASLTNNVLTNLAQLTINLPETGTKTFRSAILNVTFNDIITATGGSLTTKTINLRLGAAAYTSIANANTSTNSGENSSFWLAQDYTSHFITNWTGTSMTCDVQLQINQSTGTTLGMVNVSATLEITYEYDDTSATQIKTVFIPLNAPIGALATTATTYDTIPALNTYLPEASKVYRNIHLIFQGNEHRNAATTGHTLTLRVGTATVTSGNYEGALASDKFFRYVWNLTAVYPNTSATQTFQPTSTVARCNHPQAYLVVTYEYNESATTSVMNSLMLPMEIESPFGGPSSIDYQRATRDLWIQEPGPIVTNRIAFFPFWTQVTAIAGLNMRIGSGAFVGYTDTAQVLCGSNGCMIRNDTAFILGRGKNTLNFDIYTTDTLDFGWNSSGFWIINYTSSKAVSGTGSHNHTVFTNITQNGTGAVALKVLTTPVSVQIPETEYFINALGTRTIVLFQGLSLNSGTIIQVERLVAEGGIQWEDAYRDQQQSDPEVGAFLTFSQVRHIFKRFSGDNFNSRIDIETARRWGIYSPPAAAGTGAAGWYGCSLIMTYHSIQYNINGTLTGSFNGLTTLELLREDTNEKLKETTRNGDGSFNFTWFDNTVPVFIKATDNNGDVGLSFPNVAGVPVEIIKPNTGSSGPTYFAY
jgi:hypothetical protein